MNLLQITQTKIYPPTQGGEHRSHGLTLAFQEGEHQTIRYCVGGPLSNHELPEIEYEVKINNKYKEIRPANPLYDLPSIPSTLLNVPGTLVNQVLKYSPTRQLQSLVRWADVILVQGPHLVPPVIRLANNTPVIYSSHNVEVDRWRTLSDSSVKRYFYNELYENEKIAVEQSDATICVSEADKQRYDELFSPSSPMWIIPNGTSKANLRERNIECENRTVRERYGIEANQRVAVFVGSDYGPNITAVEKLLQFAEHAEREGDAIHFLVAGTVCDYFEEEYSTLTLTGFIEDIEEIYDVGDIALNPITEGAGSNIKIVDYMAQSLPTITTSFGARGFDLTDGETAFVRDLESFYYLIRHLDEDDLKKVGSSGQDLVREQYIWEVLSNTVLEYLQKVK
ncbi:glycosyltransferase family 4 protein [Haloarcula sp. 1CSR25-25]|uniref:glycosyltransferase family 4 protein n=1 Tax=Haloarcula sp. 1CSR25-25 TaxID=2862545 RepID=UPI002893FD92|nr:glycosyltransferase family 4 protein [Haloarcula sp. 1CSR25-25]MDT3435564.1 glycosyltransferase family 4 protein [Haloarcula sp. 1CSR25-25]